MDSACPLFLENCRAVSVRTDARGSSDNWLREMTCPGSASSITSWSVQALTDTTRGKSEALAHIGASTRLVSVARRHIDQNDVSMPKRMVRSGALKPRTVS